MAKDGTNRGGLPRIGAGRKSKSINEKILDGQLPKIESGYGTDENFDTPPIKEYLTAEQKGGSQLCSKLVYQEMYRWLKSVGCEKIVPKQLIENYSLTMARHIQCEEILSNFGLLARHPTTGEPTTSPFQKMSLDYMKQSNQQFYQIYSIVKENSAKGQLGLLPQSETMETLLRRVK